VRSELKLEQAGDIQTHRVDSEAIEAGVLDQFDVLFAPGAAARSRPVHWAKKAATPSANSCMTAAVMWHLRGAYLASHSKTQPYLGLLNATIGDFNRGRAV